MPLVPFSIHLSYHHRVVKDIYYSSYDARCLVYYGSISPSYYSSGWVRSSSVVVDSLTHTSTGIIVMHCELKGKSHRQYTT